jgi:ankyrin repeat protein
MLFSCSSKELSVYDYAIIGYLKDVQKSVEAGFDINKRDSSMKSLLMYACREGKAGQFEVIKYLIGKGADLNLRDADGRNVLYYTHYSKNKEMALFLIKSGAKIDFLDNKNNTLLLDAISSNNIDEVKWYLEIGANPNFKASTNGSLLGFAKWKIEQGNGSQEIVESLQKFGAIK